MRVDEALRLMAGVMVLASAALAVWVSPWWLALAAFVGVNLVQSAFSKWCPMMTVFRRAGLLP